jgi:hypothetical protein
MSGGRAGSGTRRQDTTEGDAHRGWQAQRRCAGRRRGAHVARDAEPEFFDWLRRELGLSVREVRGSGLVYDANQPPDPSIWLTADEVIREKAVHAYHAGLTDHPLTQRPGLHTALHMIVENQLAPLHQTARRSSDHPTAAKIHSRRGIPRWGASESFASRYCHRCPLRSRQSSSGCVNREHG